MLPHYGFIGQHPFLDISMKKIFSVIILLLVLSLSGIAKNKWKKIPVSTNVIKIIGGESANDFWLLDTANSIIHYNDLSDEIYTISEISNTANIKSIRPFYFNNNKVFVCIIDNNWMTHIASIENGIVRKYDYTNNGPLQYIEFINGYYYAFGDFGTIVKLMNGKWSNVESPIDETFNTVISDGNDKLYLNVRNNGVWSFDGDSFIHFNIPNKDNKLNYSIKLFNNNIYVLNYQGQVFRLQNDSFIYYSDHDNSIFNLEDYLNSNEVGVYDSNRQLISIPLYINPSLFKVLKDNSVLILNKNGDVYHNYSVEYNFFRNYASTKGVEGVKYSSPKFIGGARSNIKNTSIVLYDISANNRADILIFDGFTFVDKYLFTNTDNGMFINNTEEFGLNNFSIDGIVFSAIDLNQDYKPELITTFSNKRNQLSILQISNNVFSLNSTIDIPENYLTENAVFNNYTDIDKDGDIDIVSSFGYSTKGSGGVVVFHNNGYGDFSEADTSLSSMLRGWNVSTLVSDFNNDGLNDILLCKNWGHNIILFQKEKNKWEEYKLDEYDTNIYTQRKFGNIAFDYDNDGDLDIFSSVYNTSISVFENNGEGKFTNITKKIGFDTLVKKGNYYINSADFNNDGFEDIILVSTNKSNNIYLLLNDSLGHFKNHSKEMGIPNASTCLISTADIDNDGDIDIYGLNENYNKLWINNLDNSNYIKIKLKGVKSNSVGLGAKVWLYESGHIDNANFLKGYQQLGSKEFGLRSQSELMLHFGLDASRKYDIKVQFYGGELKNILNVSAGQTIIVEENIGLLAFYYSIDNTLYQLLNNRVFIIYFVIISIGLLALFLSIYYGNKLFDWNVRLTSIIISLDIILFISLLLALNDVDSIYRYIIPLGSAVLGSLGPLSVFIWIDRFNSLQSSDEVDYELFNALRNFSHGEWAASNLNSLQLLFENLSLEDINDQDYVLPFNNRKTNFLELTKPLIEDIISLSSKLEVSKDSSESINVELDIITKCLKKDINNSTLDNKDQIAKSIIKLRENIRLLRKLIFRNHSCSPFKVYKNISENIEQLTKEANVKLVFKTFMNEKEMALMDAASLANIIDNCVNNSLKAMNEVSNKVLTIKLINDDLRYFVSISDNGCGVHDQDIIFDNGYSTNASTGFGLYYAKDTLSKYGARIYVKNSEPWVLTTFIIELQKNNNR